MLYRLIPRSLRTELARLIGTLGAGSGLIGIIAGFSDHGWKLGVTGWLVLGVFGSATHIAILLDQYIEDRAAKG